MCFQTIFSYDYSIIKLQITTLNLLHERKSNLDQGITDKMKNAIMKFWKVLLHLEILYGISCQDLLFQHGYTDKVLNVTQYEEALVESVVVCCLRCLQKISCNTVNIKEDQLPMKCRLIEYCPINSMLVEKSGWNIYKANEFTVCRILVLIFTFIYF